MLRNIIDKIRFMRNPVAFSRRLGVTIGDNCQIMGTHHPFGTEPYLIQIGNHVRINDGVQFITHDGGVWCIRWMPELTCGDDIKMNDIDLFGKIVIGDNVQIGSRVLIMPGVTIGSNVIIGAGAIVTRDVPNDSVAVGVPARVIESIQDYYNKNRAELLHTKGLSYKEKRDYLVRYFGIEK